MRARLVAGAHCMNDSELSLLEQWNERIQRRMKSEESVQIYRPLVQRSLSIVGSGNANGAAMPVIGIFTVRNHHIQPVHPAAQEDGNEDVSLRLPLPRIQRQVRQRRCAL